MQNKPTNSYHPFKAVAIDLDGTLFDHDLSISPENRAAIEDLHANGVHIILASGRHQISMQPIARSLPQVEWMVACQGAFTSKVDFSETLYDCHLNAEQIAYALDVGVKHGYSTIAYAKSGLYTLGESEWTDYYQKLTGMIPEIVSRETILNGTIFKVILLDSKERIDQALQLPEVIAWPEYQVRSLENIMEFAGRGTSKAHGLKPLLNHLGIEAAELVTFGDAPNDIPMFELAGFSVAMSNAWPEAKRAAHAVSPEGPRASSFARGVALMRAQASASTAGR